MAAAPVTIVMVGSLPSAAGRGATEPGRPSYGETRAGEYEHTGGGPLLDKLERTRTVCAERSQPDRKTGGSVPCSHGGENQVRVDPAEAEQTIGGGTDEDQKAQDDPLNTDPGHWSNNMNEQVHSYWEKMGPEVCQNREADLSASEGQYKHQRRFFSRKHLKGKLSNGECLPREWLCYSLSQGSVFCFASKIFGESNEKSPFGSVGYSNRRHASERIAEHESSGIHKKVMIAYIKQAANRGHRTQKAV